MTKVRQRMAIRGVVQGVGFRPFAYVLARELGVAGWVSNSPQGVAIDVEGSPAQLAAFLRRLETDAPPLSLIQSIETTHLDPAGYREFSIRESGTGGEHLALVLPDVATCPDCVKELFDPLNRRHLYPFVNCTHCGPRFSIMTTLPYDRCNTSMNAFAMCPDCQGEYDNPADRRFHAQPNACPVCGPHVELWNGQGDIVAAHHAALLAAAESVRQGGIVALKGIGGFQFLVDGRNEEAVRRLRERKRREEKPLALMFPSLATIGTECHVNVEEERLLRSAASPIVLLKRISGSRGKSVVAPSVAPLHPYVGVMLPYTPLHHVLMSQLGFPVVATSGNLSDEPICIDEREALDRLAGIADVFLVHNRTIVRHVDDSVVRVLMGREMVVRRARGYAPLPVEIPMQVPTPLLAVGAHLKNTVALASGRHVFLSQHIGDLETKEAFDAFRNVTSDLQVLFDRTPGMVVCDQHPDYVSTGYARGLDLTVHAVQHHVAHVASCMAENQLTGDVLGVAWDGTGYGPDGTIWGGEFLVTQGEGFSRFASFRPFRLPGGEMAVKEPRRTALGLLFEMYGDRMSEMAGVIPIATFTDAELLLIRRMLTRGFLSPLTSSVGRLFDGLASLLGLRQRAGYEGQAAIDLESAIGPAETTRCYDHPLTQQKLAQHDSMPPRFIVEWMPLVLGVLDDVRKGVDISVIAAAIHNTLVESIVSVAQHADRHRVVLSGGCFQNAYLLEHTVRRLREEGFTPYWHQRVPTNDGGIALGQVYASLGMSRSGRSAVSTPAPLTHQPMEEELL